MSVKDFVRKWSARGYEKGETHHFGILTSSIHMSWMRAVAGRLKSDYRYSGSVVYNNFAWCEPTLEQKTLIEATAQEILDVRAKYQAGR